MSALQPCYLAGISDTDYHADRSRVSSSSLKTLVARSPAHARADLDTPRHDTPALALGRAVHARLLEPESFPERYAVAPQVDRRTKAGRQAWADFAAAHPGAVLLSDADAAVIDGIAASVARHRLASAALQGGEAELSGFFDDPETGALCRIRPDYLRAADSIMVDVKTAIEASPGAFQRAINSFGYHIQAAFYSMGHERITGEPLSDFLFLAVEKTPPYAVGLYRIDDDALAAGRQQMRRALRTWAACMENDTWPGYSDHIQPISLPAWALFNAEEEELAA